MRLFDSSMSALPILRSHTGARVSLFTCQQGTWAGFRPSRDRLVLSYCCHFTIFVLSTQHELTTPLTLFFDSIDVKAHFFMSAKRMCAAQKFTIFFFASLFERGFIFLFTRVFLAATEKFLLFFSRTTIRQEDVHTHTNRFKAVRQAKFYFTLEFCRITLTPLTRCYHLGSNWGSSTRGTALTRYVFIGCCDSGNNPDSNACRIYSDVSISEPLLR